MEFRFSSAGGAGFSAGSTPAIASHRPSLGCKSLAYLPSEQQQHQHQQGSLCAVLSCAVLLFLWPPLAVVVVVGRLHANAPSHCNTQAPFRSLMHSSTTSATHQPNSGSGSSSKDSSLGRSAQPPTPMVDSHSRAHTHTIN